MFYAPYHPIYSASLTRKPDSLMLEKAIAKYRINIYKSWMIGDKETDIIAAKKMHIRAILLTNELNKFSKADIQSFSLQEAVEKIILPS